MSLRLSSRKLLQDIQTDFPLVPRPFEAMARKAGCSEQEVVALLKKLSDEKTLRYIGAIFDLRKLGLVSSLVAMKVPEARLKKCVRVINAYPNVSHNYLRDDAYNVWFTLSAASETRRKNILKEIRIKTGIEDMLDLRTQQVFKSRAVFDLGKT